MKMLSVTEVLQPFTDFSMISEERLAAACERGKAVHEYLFLYVQDLYCPRPRGLEGYCQSAEKWLDANLKTVLSAEREYTDSVFFYKGHPDLLMEDQRGAVLLIDFKTPITESRSWAIQLSAYAHLVRKPHKLSKKKVSPAALMLSPTGGNARFKGYYENIDYYFSLFLSALNLSKYFKEGNE